MSLNRSRGQRFEMRLRILVAATSLFGVAACATSSMNPPSGPGTFAPDGATAIMQVSNSCIEDSTGVALPWQVDVAVTGSVRNQRISEHVRAALAGRGARIEFIRNEQPSIVFASGDRAARAALLLRDANQVVRAESLETITEQLFGFRLDAGTLGQIVRGCVLFEPFGYVTGFGEHWRRIPGGNNGSVFAYRESGAEPWRARILYYPGEPLQWSWRLEYRDLRDGIARTLRVVSPDSGAFELDFVLLDVQRGASFTAATFDVDVPSSARTTPVSELSASKLFPGVAHALP